MLWGMRLADVLSETPDGTVLLDLRKFHDLKEGHAEQRSFPAIRALRAEPQLHSAPRGAQKLS